MALSCYFDGSEKNGVLTLGAVAADQRAWTALELDWRELLLRSGVKYMHMAEAMSLSDTFMGMDKEQRDWLIDALATTLTIHQRSGLISTYSCSVDLVAHTEINARYQLPSQERICVRNIFPKIVEWYAAFPDTFLDAIDLYFDQGESFMAELERDRDTLRGQYPVWGLVRKIAPAVMRVTPGIQMADMMAWSRVIAERGPSERWYPVARLTLTVVNNHGGRFDREKLLTYPPFAIL